MKSDNGKQPGWELVLEAKIESNLAVWEVDNAKRFKAKGSPKEYKEAMSRAKKHFDRSFECQQTLEAFSDEALEAVHRASAAIHDAERGELT